MKAKPGPNSESCTAVLNLITDYVEGKLGPDEERVVTEHVDRCPRCAADFRASLFMNRLVKDNLSFPDPPEDLARSVLRNVVDQHGAGKK